MSGERDYVGRGAAPEGVVDGEGRADGAAVGVEVGARVGVELGADVGVAAGVAVGFGVLTATGGTCCWICGRSAGGGGLDVLGAASSSAPTAAPTNAAGTPNRSAAGTPRSGHSPVLCDERR